MARPLVPMAPTPGRPPKHGARALARALEQRKLDRRTRPARLRQRAANLIAEDAGGWPCLNNRQAMVVWAAASTWVVLSVRLDALLSGKGDESEPSLKWLVAMLNSFGRYMDRLGLSPKKLTDELPSLSDYLAQRSQIAPEPASHTEDDADCAVDTQTAADGNACASEAETTPNNTREEL